LLEYFVIIFDKIKTNYKNKKTNKSRTILLKEVLKSINEPIAQNNIRHVLIHCSSITFKYNNKLIPVKNNKYSAKYYVQYEIKE